MTDAVGSLRCRSMALAGRSRRGGGRRWIVVGLVLTLLVLLVDASIKSRSQTPARLLSGQAWVDRVVPIITDSNVSGRDFQELRAGSAALPAVTLDRDLATMAKSTRNTYHAYEKLSAPTNLSGPASLLGACLLLRSQATATVVAAIQAQLAGPAGDPARTESQRMASAVHQLELADSAYGLFAGRMPTSIAGRMPPSAWVLDASLFTPASLTVWLRALHSRISLVSINTIQIVEVSTTPAPLSLASKTETLPAAQLHVSVVVGNTGNQAQGELRVKAAVSRATGRTSVSDIISGLSAGSDTTVTLGPLSPRIGVTVTLTVTVSPLSGSPTKPVSRTITFVMPSSTSTSTTTTTTAPPRTTTVPTTATTLPGSVTTLTTTPPATTPPQTTPTTPPPTTPTTPAQTTTTVAVTTTTRPHGG
jgi:hypothetical protein